MAPASFKPTEASAPGSLMLLGEYAVLNGKPALVCAIDQRITATLTPHNDDRVIIQSDLAEHTTTRDTLASHPALTFVMTALQQAPQLPCGFTLSLQSQFSSMMGLGSSAAVTVATLQTVYHALEHTLTPEALWHQAMKVVHAVQGKGSGADVAASIQGGLLRFQNAPLNMTPISNLLPITVIFSGHKASTSEAIKKIAIDTAWDDAMGALTDQAITALKTNNWEQLGKLFNQGHALLAERGVSNDTLNHIAATLREQPNLYGAKISGAGLGDCIIGLGASDTPTSLERLPLSIGHQGVRAHA